MSVRSEIFTAEPFQLPHSTLRVLRPQQADFFAQHLVEMDPWLTLGYAQPALRGYLQREDPGLHRFVLESAAEPAGIFCVRYPWLLGPYVELLAILPRSQGHGLGREALGWLEQQAGLSASNLWTLVSAFNLRARSFYQGCGFKEVAELADLIQKGCNEVLLRKVLAPTGQVKDLRK